MINSLENATINVIQQLDVNLEAPSGYNIEDMAWDILLDLQFISRFKMNVTQYQWGTSHTNDPFGELAGKLFKEGKADLAGSYYYIFAQRLVHGVPLIPLSSEKFMAFFRQPETFSLANNWQGLFVLKYLMSYLPFISILTPSIFAIFAILKKYSFKWKCLANSVWWTILFISLKGYKFRKGEKATFKILFFIGSTAFWILYVFYNATMISILTIHNPPIKSIEDLIRYGFKFFAPGQMDKVLFSKSSYKKASSGLSEADSFRKLVEGGKGLHVHVDNSDNFYEYARVGGINLEMMCKNVSQLPFHSFKTFMMTGFFIPKTSVYRSLFNHNILKIHEGGLMDRYERKYTMFNVYTCPNRPKPYQDNLGISHVIYIFLCLIATLPFIFAIIIAEKWRNFRVPSPS